MHINIAVSPLEVLGLILCAYLAGLAGNVLGLLLVGIFKPSLDGVKIYTLSALLIAMGSMTPLKLLVALASTIICLYLYGTAGGATMAAMAVPAALGFLFTTVAGALMKF